MSRKYSTLATYPAFSIALGLFFLTFLFYAIYIIWSIDILSASLIGTVLIVIIVLFLYQGIKIFYIKHFLEEIIIDTKSITHTKNTIKKVISLDAIEYIVVSDIDVPTEAVLDEKFDHVGFVDEKVKNSLAKVLNKETTLVTWSIYIVYGKNNIIKLLKSDFSRSDDLLRDFIRLSRKYNKQINLEAYLKHNSHFTV